MHYWYQGFSPLKEVGSSFPMLVIVRTFNSIGLRVDMEHQPGILVLPLDCWMVVYCRLFLSTNPSSWLYDNHDGLSFSYCLCITLVNPICYLHDSSYMVALLMFDNSVLFNGEGRCPNSNECVGLNSYHSLFG
jgi:hypothetical protein